MDIGSAKHRNQRRGQYHEVMLCHVRLTDFKSFADEQGQLAPWTLLVGANASGKSNFLDALRFVHALSLGWSVHECLAGRTEGGHRIWPGIRGAAQEVPRIGAKSFGITCAADLSADRYSYQVRCDAKSVERESLDNCFEATKSPDLAHPGKDLAVSWLPGSMRPQALHEDTTHSVLSTSASRSNIWSEALRGFFSSMVDLQLNPDRMRGYDAKPQPGEQPTLALDGSNLSGVLWALCREEAHRQEIIDWVSELCAPEIADLSFIETEAGDVLLQIHEHDGKRITAKSMSEGTLRFLGLLVALMAAPGTCFLIEDVDAGLHPTRLHLLADFLEAATGQLDVSARMSRRVPRQVIATTHSPKLLEVVAPETLESTLLFARPSSSGGSVIRSLQSLPGFEDVMQRRGIDQLFTSSWLEHAV